MTVLEQRFFEGVPGQLHTIGQVLTNMQLSDLEQNNATRKTLEGIETELYNLNRNMDGLIEAIHILTDTIAQKA